VRDDIYTLNPHPLIGRDGGGDEAAAEHAVFVLFIIEYAGLPAGDAFT
tara:strand:+ start:75603 stop:75746 length:144 start_codon:yes stop_codon:yes gene_type:complete